MGLENALVLEARSRLGVAAYFCVGQYLRRYDLIGTKGLPWVYE